VRWTSPREIETGEKTHYIRPRTIAYAVALTVVFVALIVMGTKKEHMLLNINKTAQLYRFTHDGKVVNDYTFLFQNTDSKDHKYYFKIVGHPEIKILKPTKAFNLAAGKKAKKIVTLWATQPLAKDTRKDTPVPIKIKAFAVDDPEKIVVERDTVFVYPRWDIVQKKLKK
jgi:polyferredoxin